jgi:D-alanyl-D-alanine carboxypeptidase
MVGGKTGYTRNAKHCFVGAMDTDNGLMFAAVLGASSRSRLWKCAEMLADIATHLQPDTPTKEPQTPAPYLFWIAFAGF